jgi:hypothetical protein
MGTPVSTPDIQYFGSDGTWIKPSRAARVDVIVQGGRAVARFAPRPGQDTGEAAKILEGFRASLAWKRRVLAALDKERRA